MEWLMKLMSGKSGQTESIMVDEIPQENGTIQLTGCTEGTFLSAGEEGPVSLQDRVLECVIQFSEGGKGERNTRMAKNGVYSQEKMFTSTMAISVRGF